MEAIITLKNYRCFEDKNPLQIKISKGFTSLIGPNNSGKTSFLKFFYEFLHLWYQQQSIGSLGNLIRNKKSQIDVINLRGLIDNQEIFTNINTKPLSIEIEIIPDNKQEPYLSFAKYTITRKNPNSCECSYYYKSHKGSTTGRIEANVRTIKSEDGFHNINDSGIEVDCIDFLGLMKCLSKVSYIGAFRNAITEGDATYYDIGIGTKFISTWNKWKSGSSKSNNERILQVEDDIEKIFRFNSLEINAADNLKTLQVIINKKPYKLHELGAGIAQFIIVLGNAAIRNPSYILIDEPELNLHPSLQIDFLTSLASYANEGIIFASHSVGLARATSDQIYSFRATENGTLVKEFEQTTNYAEFIGEMSFSSYKEMGFNKLLLVEGPKELKTIQQFLRKQRKDHEILMLSLGGSSLINGNVEQELGELKRITLNISCLIDSEKNNEGESLSQGRQDFINICKKLGINIHVTERRAFENYFSDSAIKKVKGDKHRSLEHFEKLSDCNPGWGKHENWRIAREMDWDEIKNTDVGEFIKSL